MYRLALFIIVASIVMGAAGVVYLINAIKYAKDRRKHVAMTTLFFFGAASTALLAAYMTKRGGGGGRRTPVPEARTMMDPSVMLAASAGAGSIMT